MSDELTREQRYEIERQQEAERLATLARKAVVAKTNRQRRLIENMRGDLARHGDPERWKRLGDLLLANISTAVRDGGSIRVVDYFDDSTPIISIVADERLSINEAAESYFRRYTKARNAIEIVNSRIVAAETELARIERLSAEVDNAFAGIDIERLRQLSGEKPPPKPVSKKRKAENEFRGARRFISSDGLEIWVGKRAADNDFLTFRVANSFDLWLHAADYPGSHVVVRNRKREETPQRTLIEAAEVAAFYSDARGMGKAAVNYTLKKYVNKPRRAAPGLVSLSQHRTVMVEPRVNVKKVEV